MTQEEKELLLKDLGGRLSYGVKVLVQSYKGDFIGTLVTVTTKLSNTLGEVWIEETDESLWCDYRSFKPYLRPMPSMTEEEKGYVKNRWCYDDWTDIHDFLNNYKIDAVDARDFIDWLNKKMFDYRGLIPMGMTLEAPKGMYKELKR